MDRADEWLTVTFDARNDVEPPLLPNVPLDYLAEPRKKRPKSSVLPRSHSPVISRAKRKRATLAEIDPPNDLLLSPVQESSLPLPKRQRPTKALDMAHQPRSPSKKKYEARNQTSTADNTMDLEATPTRPRHSNLRAAQPLSETAIPNLLPSTSEGEVENLHQPDSAVSESADSRVSKRSVSPTKRMVDLRVADKRIIQKSIQSRLDVPGDVGDLFKKIQSLATFARNIVPKGIEDEVEGACGDIEPFDPLLVAEQQDGVIDKERLLDELKAIKDIRDGTSFCKAKHVHEPTWNERVHSRILQQAVKNLTGFEYHNITTARVLKGLVPANKYGEELKKKMVDYAVTLQDPLVAEDHITYRLASSAGRLYRTINPSDYSPLCHDPIVVSIETKTPDGSREKALVQLSIWVTAHFNRLRALAPDPISITLPLLFVSGEHWQLMFARDLDDSIDIIDGVTIGNTESILGCYKILAALRHLCGWAASTFQPWFVNNVLTPE